MNNLNRFAVLAIIFVSGQWPMTLAASNPPTAITPAKSNSSHD